ncbi:MAG: RNA polymerase sporulation sigma factor SigK [Clostridia bacterium]|nr:RNA polymerase sporulation sigma factor SigK [Clostridia bacterium]
MLGNFLAFIFGKILFFAGSIVGSTSFEKPLSGDEEKECILLAAKGDASAKEKLITHNMRLVAHVVKKYSGSAETDDLISVGSIGLIKAVNTYNGEKNTAFATYAARCIENEILMLLRAGKKHKNDVSLFDPVGSDKEGNELMLMDVLSEKEDSVFAEVDRGIERGKIIDFIKSVLTKREYAVIRLRYGIECARPYAQREVAAFLKISRSYVSRIEKKAIEKLKDAGCKQFYC